MFSVNFCESLSDDKSCYYWLRIELGNTIMGNPTSADCCCFRVEHLHESELSQLPKAIFGQIAPQLVIMTTPNAEFNVLFPNLTGFRHPDHKFEWTRQQFGDWYLLCPFSNTVIIGQCYL